MQNRVSEVNQATEIDQRAMNGEARVLGRGPQIWVEGAEVSAMLKPREARTVDSAGGECDGLWLSLYPGSEMLKWELKTNDRIRLRHESYDTGDMYLDYYAPQQGGLTIAARSAPVSDEPKWACYENTALQVLAFDAADALGLQLRFYGRSAYDTLRRVVRRNKGWLAFLDELCGYENARLKLCDGKLIIIDMDYLYREEAVRRYEITPKMRGVRYERNGERLRTLAIQSFFGAAQAEDTEAAGSLQKTLGGLPVFDNAQAARWARGALLRINEGVEKVELKLELDTGIAAMCRVDLFGLPLFAGEWITERVEHDFLNAKTTIRLVRVLR